MVGRKNSVYDVDDKFTGNFGAQRKKFPVKRLLCAWHGHEIMGVKVPCM
jgi:hypothetical protein